MTQDDEALCNLADRWVAAMRQSDNTREAAVMSALAARIQELTAPPSGDVVERVARALAALEGDPDEAMVCWETPHMLRTSEPRWKFHQDKAKAAIAAMPDHPALIVAWLRGETGCAFSRDVLQAADLIERGDYLKDTA